MGAVKFFFQKSKVNRLKYYAKDTKWRQFPFSFYHFHELLFCLREFSCKLQESGMKIILLHPAWFARSLTLVPRYVLCSAKPHGNACYAGYAG